MSEFERKQWELRRLLSLARDCELDEEESKQFEQLLADNPELRKHYVELIVTETHLESLHSRPLLDMPQLLEIGTGNSEHNEDAEVRSKSEVLESKAKPNGATSFPFLTSFEFPRPSLASSVARWSLAAVALIALVTLAGYVFNTHGAATVVAIDAGGTEQFELTVGDSIDSSWVSINSGVVHLSFHSTAMVAVHGPAEFRALGPNQVELAAGELSVHVPEAAVGFSVVTDQVDVVDLGTSFSMNLQENGELTVHVTDGKVRVKDKPRRKAITATAGQLVTTDLKSDSDNRQLRILQSAKTSMKLRGQMKFSEKHPVSLGFGVFERDHVAFVFLESNQRRLPFDLPVNLAEPGEYTSFNRTAHVIPEGTIVDCYLVHCAPQSASHEVRGSITFPGEILGVICDHDRLNSTNDVLGSSWTLRCNYIHRGLELVPTPSADVLTIRPDRRTISALLRNSAIDQFRVLVKTK